MVVGRIASLKRRMTRTASPLAPRKCTVTKVSLWPAQEDSHDASQIVPRSTRRPRPLLPRPCPPPAADGLIVIHNPPTVVPGHFSFAPLEVTYHKVECDIKDQVAVTTVDQEFYNPNAAVLGAITSSRCRKTPTSTSSPWTSTARRWRRNSSRRTRPQNLRGHRPPVEGPALLEYAGRAMFKVRIFPIEANSRKRQLPEAQYTVPPQTQELYPIPC